MSSLPKSLLNKAWETQKTPDIALQVKPHHCRGDDNHCPSSASDTLPKAALPHCFTYSDSLVLLAQAKHSIHQHTSSFSAGLLLTQSPPSTYKCTGLFHLRCKALHLASFPQGFCWLSPQVSQGSSALKLCHSAYESSFLIWSYPQIC